MVTDPHPNPPGPPPTPQPAVPPGKPDAPVPEHPSTGAPTPAASSALDSVAGEEDPGAGLDASG